MNRASSILFWFSITLLVSLGLYHTSYRVDHLTNTLNTLNKHITKEQRTIHILKAEWVYLSIPDRIARASHKYLSLKPTKTEQFTSLRKLSSRLPTKREAIAFAQKMATRRSNRHAIASTPKIATSESGRINQHLVINNASSYNLSNNGSYKIGSLGGAP